MDQKKKQILVVKLEKHLARIREDVKRARESLQFYSEQAMSSWSIAGERKHAETDLKLALDLLKKTQRLCRETAACPETKAVKLIPSCYVVVKFDVNGKEDEFYFLETNLQVPNIKIVSPSSPLGRAISNKKPGSRFSYKISGNLKKSISGIIKSIE